MIQKLAIFKKTAASKGKKWKTISLICLQKITRTITITIQ